MDVKIVAFGIAKDILNGSETKLSTPDNITVEALLVTLKAQYPAFQELASLVIAVNEEYADPQQIIRAGDEVVLIPPVAGG